MRAVVQRVSHASVTVDGTVTGEIGNGLLVLLGIAATDSDAETRWLARKILDLRIFPDAEGRMNRSLADADGRLLVVSQFTLYADVRKGRRPSYNGAAEPKKARELYEDFVALCEKHTVVRTGVFQAHMNVELVNDGPVTIILDTENR